MALSPYEKFVSQYLPPLLSDATIIDELTRHFSLTEYNRKHVLIQENQRHNFAYYILKGAVRSYYLKDGTEVNTWFAFENDIVGSLCTYRELPSHETVELLEDSVFIAINLSTLRPLTQTHIAVSNFVRAIIEEHTLFLENRLYFLQHVSAAERYAHLLAYEPEVLHRVPLTYIASYLGVSRETLSRLRAK